MGILLGQLPPAEIARLKAELAETLIANFCYPRFYDYRTGTLRMRPVDRTKRQEVWLYLSSIDFTAWNRVDLMSPDFQRYIERLFVQFVKRNRSFFGQQGRKRMPDVRTLISSSATSVTEGLRGHLTGRHTTNPSFGSPRPVIFWSITNITGRPEPHWEQIVQMTMLLQQQMQEVRGEIKTPPPGESRPAAPAVRRVTRARSSGNGASNLEHEGPPSQPTVINIPAPKEPARTTTSLAEPRHTTPLPPPPADPSASSTTAAPVQKDEDQTATPTELPARRTAPPRKSPELDGRKPQVPEPLQSVTPPLMKQTHAVPLQPLPPAAPPAPPAPLREVPPQPSASAAPSAPTGPLREVPPQPLTSVTPPPAVVPARGVPPQPAAPMVAPPSRPLLRDVPPSMAPSREVPPPSQAPVAPASPVAPREVPPPVQAQSFAATPPPVAPAREVPPVIPSVEASHATAAASAPTEQLREVTQIKPQATSVPARKTESAAALIGNEDMAIFEQLRHQLVIWLRIEAVRSGADIAGLGPTQLLELLRQQESFDETRLQVVTTLLNLSNQVITSGHASLLDYKQGLLFYLMHTRRS